MGEPKDASSLFRLTPFGRKEWGLCLALGVGGGILLLIALGLLAGAWSWGGALGGVAIVGGLMGTLFFRDPPRKVDDDPASLVAPADGVVVDIEKVFLREVDEFDADAEFLRIGIFLSVLDVHINRSPCSWKVAFKSYKEGKFHDARSPLAAKENESLLMAGWGEVLGEKIPIAVRQVSGAIARRIVCSAQTGDALQKGQRYGMIKFGSRTELFLPADGAFELSVGLGDRVRAGTTVLACWTGRPRE